MQKISTVTCPECGFKKKEEMPVDMCVITYECCECKKLLFPQTNKCCIYCSYGDIPCPPVQKGEECC